MTRSSQDTLTAIDIGSSKVVCFIATPDDTGTIRVRGMGVRRCKGMRAGLIVDMAETERAIRSAVEQAEQISGETVDTVHAGLSTARLSSRIVEADMPLGGERVEQSHLAELLEIARAQVDPGDDIAIHAFPACFTIDGVPVRAAPTGLYADRLGVNLHVVTTPAAGILNLKTCLKRAHLTLEKVVASPYAAGLSALAPNEAELGAAVIDMGAGLTHLAIFAEGAMLHADCVPYGGANVTWDIAQGLLTPLEDAERLKTLHGSAVSSPADMREMISVVQLGESEDDPDGTVTLTRAELNAIIRPRLEATFEQVRDKLLQAGFSGKGARRVVLTGGASLLPGVRELAQSILGKDVRIGRPRGIRGLAESTSGPAFASCAGLLLYRLAAPREVTGGRNDETGRERGLSRMGRWLRDNF